MPGPDQILADLSRIANDNQLIAIYWHAYYFALIVLLIMGVRITKRFMAVLLSIPFLSVAGFAWTSGNLFNGIFFIITTFVLLMLATRLPPERIELSSLAMSILGSFMFLFGLIYPHFLRTESWWTYLYASPTGLIPCPTLSASIGVAMMVNGLNSRAWTFVLGLTGLFYAIFGLVRLGVFIDIMLLLGALIIIIATWSKSQLILKGVQDAPSKLGTFQP